MKVIQRKGGKKGKKKGTGKREKRRKKDSTMHIGLGEQRVISVWRPQQSEQSPGRSIDGRIRG